MGDKGDDGDEKGGDDEGDEVGGEDETTQEELS